MDDRSPSGERQDSTSGESAPTHLENAEHSDRSREEQLQAELEHLIHRAVDLRMAEEEGVDLDAEGALSGLDLDGQSFYREFVAKSNDAMYVVDLFGTFKFVNQTAEQLIGYSQEDLVGKNIAQFLYPDGLRKAASIMALLIRGRKIPPHELVVKAADGDRVGEMNATLIRRGAFPVGVLGIARDVTERKEFEKALRESEARLQATVESLPFDFFALDTGGRYIMQNSFCRKNWGDIIGRSPADVASDGETLEQWEANNRRALAGETVTGDIDLTTKGEKRHYHNIVSPILDGDEVLGVLGINIDVTDSRKVERDLESSRARFEAIFNSIAEAAVFADTERRIVTVNRTFEKLWGYRAEEVRGRTTEFLYVDRESYEKQGRERYSVDASPRSSSFETRYRHRDGTVFEAESVGTKVLDAQGAVLGYVAIHRNVTESRKAEAKLRESEERYRRLVELSPDAVAIVQDNLFAYVNPAFISLFGYSPGDIARGLNYLSITQEKDRETIRKRTRDRLAGKEAPSRYQIDLIGKDGRIHNCEVSASLIEQHGRPAVLAIFRDHTDKVLALRLLQAQHELASGLAVATSLEEGLDLCLEAAFRVSGMEAGGVYLADKEKKAFHLCYARNLSPEFVESIEILSFDSYYGKLKQEGEPVFSLTRDRPEPGRRLLEKEGVRYMAVIPLFHEKEIVGSMNMASRKVSELQPFQRKALIAVTSQAGSAVARLQGESALRESEERYRQLLENIPVVVWKTDSQGRTSFISPNVENVYGYSPEEIRRSGSEIWFGRIHDDDAEMVGNACQALSAQGQDFDIEYRIRRRDGVWIWIRDRAFSRREEGGEGHVFSVFNEITERKEAEEALRRSEEEHRALVAALAQGIQEIDREGTILFANRAHHRIYGYDEGELIGMSVLDLSPDEKSRRELAEYLEYLLEEQPDPTPWMGEDVTKDGKRILVQVDWDYKRDVSGGIVGFTAVISDITERQRAEEALRESEERYRSLVEKSEEIIFSITTEGQFNFLNPAFSRITGWKTGEWVGRSFEELVLPDDLSVIRPRFARVLQGESLPQKEVRIRTQGGGTLTVEYTSVPVWHQGKVVEVWGIARDISSRIRSEEDQRKLVALREREGISRWLHDHLGADLYNIILLVDGLQKQDPDVAIAAQQLEWISETSRKALASIRNYLDFSSQLGASFGSLLEHMEKYGRSLLTPLGVGFQVTSRGHLAGCTLSGLQSFSIYLIFKESLTNIVKHARARQVNVTVTVGEGRLEIVIADDGEGFTSDGIISGQYGTANIRARAEEMGAELYITTERQKGTRVRFALPLS